MNEKQAKQARIDDLNNLLDVLMDERSRKLADFRFSIAELMGEKKTMKKDYRSKINAAKKKLRLELE